MQEDRVSTATDSRRELTALVAGCGIYRSNYALFLITGHDRVRWLNGMVTNNIRDLAPGSGVYAFVLNSQGHILGDLYIFNTGESLIAEIERAQTEPILQILRRYIIMDKVEIADLSAEKVVVNVIGPKARDVLSSAGLTIDLLPLQSSNLTWNGINVMLVRGDNLCFPEFQLWLAADQADAVYRALQNAGAEPVGDGAQETFRILCGIPKIGQDIRERALPQETGQDRALNFNKGCYIGQEIIERIRARGNVHKMFVGFEIEGQVPAPGTKVRSGEKDVGEITSIASASLEQKRLALGYVRKEILESGGPVSAGEAVLKPRPLPFTDVFN